MTQHLLNRDGRVARLLVLVAAGVLAASSGSAQDVSAVELEATKLSDTVYLLLPSPPLAGNLAVSAGDDGILMVDTQMMPITDKIKAAVQDIQKGGVDFVVNSHYHYDHAGGNAGFGLESVIVAHETVRARLAEGREAGNRFIEGTRPFEALPRITFKDNVTFHWNGEDVDVIHLGNPAHTDGDTVIFFRDSNVIHTGDQFVMLNGFPYIDRDVGGSALGLRDNIAQVLTLINGDTKIIPGHGPLATKADLQHFHDIVSETIDHIADRKRAGKTLEEIQGEGLPEKYAPYTGFMPHTVWIGAVYASLDD
ncbi:MAG: MBL fold metallo-hydrolase [Acidobacteriota bacterium]|nr:MBL fold metallo-hydrolase [Acidobacteriota bacterium]